MTSNDVRAKAQGASSSPSGAPNARDRFWMEFYHTKIYACYLALLLQRTSRQNMAINVTIAVLGCGAVASFVKTLDANALGVVLTVMSGGLLAAKPYLPFKQRTRALRRGGP